MDNGNRSVDTIHRKMLFLSVLENFSSFCTLVLHWVCFLEATFSSLSIRQSTKTIHNACNIGLN